MHGRSLRWYLNQIDCLCVEAAEGRTMTRSYGQGFLRGHYGRRLGNGADVSLTLKKSTHIFQHLHHIMNAMLEPVSKPAARTVVVVWLGRCCMGTQVRCPALSGRALRSLVSRLARRGGR